ncbi:outer membrane usher protein [Salmonella enterica]|nr:outer membrane usher protein [Salmonella enterica]ECI4150916.1 PapC/FimD family outer membrane usher protein [Salmonella enterica subsp. salamae]HCM1852090.1 outer membrane usher protein [Salmonella enterica subsp. salamae serovar 42:z29:-]EAU0240405.1 outer membrane usher protein [Salmonella enterica]EAX3602591.1 outer membrane usher protein [Salmonella enterica]
MAHYEKFRLSTLAAVVSIILTVGSGNSYAEAPIQFNTQFLDVKNGTSLDLNRFSRKGYIMPGKYTLRVMVNESQIAQESIINYYIDDNDPDNTYPCLTPELLPMLGLKPAIAEKLTWMKSVQCLQPGQLEGMDTQTDLSQSTLKIIIPQAYLEYSDDEWDPPSRWDEGILGVLFDYNVNSQWRHSEHDGGDEYDVSGNGTLGANLGAWRLRADWQGNYRHENDNEESFGSGSEQSWDWNRYYAYRAIPQLQAQFTLGEGSLESDIFDGFNYLGGSLITDDQMLPPNLRGYAPDISGVARTNAKVTVTQRGRVIYESQVPAGPFRIQDINETVSGDLHVKIEEQNGQVQEYDVSTASIPFLTRPGQVRYKVAAGRPQDWDHHMQGGFFTTAEASWGIANGWSLYGGAIGEQDYQALAIGLGRDLALLGAISIDMTHSRAVLDEGSVYGDGTIQGNSFRASYAKDFDDIDGRLTFAGYRFSEENYMTMDEFIDAQDSDDDRQRTGHDKEMYTLTYSQNFSAINVNAYINYTHRTYWNQPTQDSYNLTLSHYFDIGEMRGISLSVNGFRNEYDNESDDGVFVSLSIPWGNNRTLSYNGSFSDDNNTNQVGYYERIDDRNNYQINVGRADNGASLDGYYRHQASYADIDASANYQEGDYTSGGLNIQGGATLTAKGGALHRTSVNGGSRLLVDVGDEANVPISGYSTPVYTNAFGKAVVADVNDYYRNLVKIDITQLPEDAEAIHSIAQATLTEGAIGYRRMEVLSGKKAMATFRLHDNGIPPFGAEVYNSRQQQLGIVGDNGSVYLIGINPGERLQVNWDGKTQCEAVLPDPLPDDLFNSLLLPCVGNAPPQPDTLSSRNPTH